MNFKYLFILVFLALLAEACANDTKNNTKESKSTTTAAQNDTKEDKVAATTNNPESITLAKSFIEARNGYNTEKLRELTVENYQELFKNEIVEIKSQEEFLSHLEWAKELSSKTTIKEVISSDDATVVVIEESTNYIDVALKRTPRNFKTTYYLKDGKIVKQSFENAPNEEFDVKANDVLYGNFERFCKVRKIAFSWEPTKKDGKILRKALELYANRPE